MIVDLLAKRLLSFSLKWESASLTMGALNFMELNPDEEPKEGV